MSDLGLAKLALQAEGEVADQELSSETREFIRAIKRRSLQECSPGSIQVMTLKPDEIERHLAAASNLLEHAFFRTNELLLAGILEVIPSCEGAMLRLAELNEKEGAFLKTVEYANTFMSRGIVNDEIAYQLAFALHKLGRQDEALEAILPLYVGRQERRVMRLCGLILKALDKWNEAIEILEKVIEESPEDIHSIRALAEIHSDLGLYHKCLEVIQRIPHDLVEDHDKLCRSLMHRLMGELDQAIRLNSEIIAASPSLSSALWTQCFNYSIAKADFSMELLRDSQKLWKLKRQEATVLNPIKLTPVSPARERLRIAFITSDIGEHVVSRFMMPILRSYNKDRYHVTLLSTHRRFEDKAVEIASCADAAISLQELNATDVYACIETIQPHVIIETNGFTQNSGIGLLVNRCAPIQCHYIGYHATTGLDTIDYFLGDSVTVPDEFQYQYTEKLVQVPSLWMAYDSTIEFPVASATAQRDSPVLGSFSQITKINRFTLDYWASALNAVPDSILVIKDRGCHCPASCKRIEDSLALEGIDPARIYFFAPVASHYDHLDAYNAIDIALDTTPWSSATTAYEALGMGVPLVAICGDTTSGRMSTSVVTAAGLEDLVAHSQEEFAQIVAKLSNDYRQIRKDKGSMQRRIRSGILFDERRICKDFFETIDSLVANHV
jgi:predicted O-linked N-acetylglucosamine transferase (SPINDLY family)